MTSTIISSKVLYKWAFSLWEQNKNNDNNNTTDLKYNSISKANFYKQKKMNYNTLINSEAEPNIIHYNNIYNKKLAQQNDIEKKYYNLDRNFIGFKKISTEELNAINQGYAFIIPKIYEIYNRNNSGKELEIKEVQEF